MNPYKFLLINGVLVGVLVFGLLLLKSQRKRPFRMNLKKKSTHSPHEEGLDIGGETELNSHFLHEGQSWDAYEVFDLPAGSDWSRVERTFSELKSRGAARDIERYEKAFELLKSRQDTRKD